MQSEWYSVFFYQTSPPLPPKKKRRENIRTDQKFAFSRHVMEIIKCSQNAWWTECARHSSPWTIWYVRYTMMMNHLRSLGPEVTLHFAPWYKQYLKFFYTSIFTYLVLQLPFISPLYLYLLKHSGSPRRKGKGKKLKICNNSKSPFSFYSTEINPCMYIFL